MAGEFKLSNAARCPFTIAIDTREQIPFSFAGMSMPIKGKMTEVEVETVERCLGNDCGDYQVEGIDDVTIERKGLEDLYRTLSPNGGSRQAFWEQVEHMNFSFRWSMIIVEAGRDDVANPQFSLAPLEWKIDANWLLAEKAEGGSDKYKQEIESDLMGTWTARSYGKQVYQGPMLSEAIKACETYRDYTWRSQLHPHTVEGTHRSWKQRFPRVHWLLAGSRREAEIETFQHLYHAWRHQKEKQKK